MRVSISGAMPIPLSRIRSTTSRPSRRNSTAIWPPGSVFLAALLSGWRRSTPDGWSSRRGSAREAARRSAGRVPQYRALLARPSIGQNTREPMGADAFGSGSMGIDRVRNMPETLWRASLVLALYRNRHVAQARYLQLATVRADGRPANRTVVFRGFLGDSERITVVTDIRSAKVRELDGAPWAEACWYFPMTREQFRLGGRAVVVREGSADEALRQARRRRLARAGRRHPPELHLAGARRAARPRRAVRRDAHGPRVSAAHLRPDRPRPGRRRPPRARRQPPEPLGLPPRR